MGRPGIRWMRPLLLALVVASTSCNVGLDPRRFERLHYGIARVAAASVLEEEARRELRFFLPVDGSAVPSEWLVERYATLHPHPDYFVIYRDDALASVLTAAALHDVLEPQDGWTPRELASLASQWVDSRLPLAWRELEPIDAREHTSSMHPTAYAFALLPLALPGIAVMPLALLMYPIIAPLIGDATVRRAELVTTFSNATAQTMSTAIERSLGVPTLHTFLERDGETVEVWTYEARHRSSVAEGVRCGFVDGTLVWIDYRTFVR